MFRPCFEVGVDMEQLKSKSDSLYLFLHSFTMIKKTIDR